MQRWGGLGGKAEAGAWSRPFSGLSFSAVRRSHWAVLSPVIYSCVSF